MAEMCDTVKNSILKEQRFEKISVVYFSNRDFARVSYCNPG